MNLETACALAIFFATLFGYGFHLGICVGRRHERTQRIATWARRLSSHRVIRIANLTVVTPTQDVVRTGTVFNQSAGGGRGD